MKKTLVGELYHDIEDLGNKKYSHVGFRDKEDKFGDIITEIVPDPGMRRKAKITIELL